MNISCVNGHVFVIIAKAIWVSNEFHQLHCFGASRHSWTFGSETPFDTKHQIYGVQIDKILWLATCKHKIWRHKLLREREVNARAQLKRHKISAYLRELNTNIFGAEENRLQTWPLPLNKAHVTRISAVHWQNFNDFIHARTVQCLLACTMVSVFNYSHLKQSRDLQFQNTIQEESIDAKGHQCGINHEKYWNYET